MWRLMSTPVQKCPASVKASPLNPEPQLHKTNKQTDKQTDRQTDSYSTNKAGHSCKLPNVQDVAGLTW